MIETLFERAETRSTQMPLANAGRGIARLMQVLGESDFLQRQLLTDLWMQQTL